MANNGFTVWKEQATGLYRWLSIYSNNFRDDDHPSEIISAESHERFVDMVNKGIVDYPELWLWHVPVVWGKADFVDYVNGFALAGGTVHKGFEATAESIAQQDDLATSHGMPIDLILYDQDYQDVIRFHITKEISPLPLAAAANKRTGFVVLKGEEEMPLSDTKKAFLAEIGKLPPAFIKSLEEQLDAAADEANRNGIESKEATPPVVTPVVEPVAVAEPAAVVVEPEVEAPNTDAKKEVTYATVEDVANVLAEVIQPMLDSHVALAGQVAVLTKELVELKRTDAEKLKEVREVTPPLSLKELVAKNLIGNPAAKIADGSPLSGDKPKEAPPVTSQAPTIVPFINGLLSTAAQSL